ncbi:MAG TPA: S8 family serine peptidase, partial [Candidatus Acidoferrales bacterium]|nr:S8 family serine peptidase [Candidatus Acidoferrales bacterium]
SAARLPAGFTRAGSFGLRWPTSSQETVAAGTLAVRFAGGHVSAQAITALSKIGAHQVSAPNPQGAVSFSIPQAMDPRSAAAAVQNVPGVLAAGPVLYRHLDTIPDDPDYVNQWDMNITQMPASWSITTGSASLRVAIIDTGYDTGNPDLAGKVDLSVVYDKGDGTVHAAAPIEDKDGHGTDVSGIAAAVTNNTKDVAGVGWNVHLIEARVFPQPAGPGANSRDIASAINWAVTNGAKVINLSLGSAGPDNVYEEPAVAAALLAGVVVVAASGNDGMNIVDYPAADPGVLAVGASAFCDAAPNVLAGSEYVAAYSNYGPQLTLVAPGGDPTKAQTQCKTVACIDYVQWIENLDSLQGPFTEEVGLFAGTSMSAPHVAGAAALVLSKNGALTPSQVFTIIKNSADPIGDPHQGSGRLNVLNALNATP